MKWLLNPNSVPCIRCGKGSLSEVEGIEAVCYSCLQPRPTSATATAPVTTPVPTTAPVQTVVLQQQRCSPNVSNTRQPSAPINQQNGRQPQRRKGNSNNLRNQRSNNQQGTRLGQPQSRRRSPSTNQRFIPPRMQPQARRRQYEHQQESCFHCHQSGDRPWPIILWPVINRTAQIQPSTVPTQLKRVVLSTPGKLPGNKFATEFVNRLMPSGTHKQSGLKFADNKAYVLLDIDESILNQLKEKHPDGSFDLADGSYKWTFEPVMVKYSSCPRELCSLEGVEPICEKCAPANSNPTTTTQQST